MIQVISSNGTQYNTGKIFILDKYGKVKLPSSGGSASWGTITGTLSSQTDLQNALNAKQDTLVSGTNIKTINTNSILGSGDLSVHDLPTGGTEGQILAKNSATNYDTTWIDNYTSTVQHTVKLAESINIGQAVYVSSANGTNIIVSKADNSTEATSSKTMGLLAFTGATNATGFVVTEGLLAGLDTSAANAAGDPVWLGTSGNLIYGLVNKPVAPAHLVFIGIVTRKQSNNGEIFIKVQNGFELRELHDVDAVSPSNNDGIFYNTTNSLWEHKSIATALGYTPYSDTNPNGYITSSALSGYLTSATAASTYQTILSAASASANGYLTSTDWSTFNSKQNAITLTTTGTSGAATLVGSTLNVPQYTGSPVYAKNSTTYSSSGTGSQILTSLLIPANTFTAGDVLRITIRWKKVGTAAASQCNILLNTSASLSGATTIKAHVTVAATLSVATQGHAVIINQSTNTQYGWTPTNIGPTDFVNSTSSFQESVATNWTSNQYIILSANPSSTDVVSVIFYMIEKL